MAILTISNRVPLILALGMFVIGTTSLSILGLGPALTRDLALCLIQDLDPLAGEPEGELDCPQINFSEFTVTAAGDGLDYFVDANRDPKLYLRRGLSYAFKVSAPNDPFFIKVNPGPGDSGRYLGVGSNGKSEGTVYFDVPLEAPRKLYYQSSAHEAMLGEIQICSPEGDTPEEKELVRIYYFVPKLQRTDLWDTNGNDKVDLSEILEYLQRLAGRFDDFTPSIEGEAEKGGMDPGEAIFNAMDLDNDGALGTAELRLQGAGPQPIHAADTNGDNVITLSELLRIVQLFNTGEFSCAADGTASEDGYLPGPGATDCLPHASDYDAQDWSFSLSEVLRAIQFYNVDGYFQCLDASPETEDGFCPDTA